MRDFIKPTGDNLGGIIQFNYIPVDDVESIAEADDGIVNEAITLKSGKEWFVGYGTLGKLGYEEPGEPASGGTIYKRNLTGFYPQDVEEMNFLFQKMRNQRFILDARDSNGRRKIIGSIDEPLTFKSSLNTQSDIPGLAGHTFSFYGEGTHKAYFYNI